MENELEYRSEAAYRKKVTSFSRYKLYLSLLISLLVPVILISGYGATAGARGIFFVALLSSACSIFAGWFLLRSWERKMQRTVAQLVSTKAETVHEFSAAKSQHEAARLHLELDKKQEEMRAAYLEFEDLRKEYHRLEEESAHLLEEGQKKLKHKDSLINEYQRTIAEQRLIIEKKQRYIANLEGKVRDLMYEVRSLLQLDTAPSSNWPVDEETTIDHFLPTPSASNTPYDFSIQLQKYVEKAESFTGVDHLGYVGGKSPRFLDLSQESYAVDRRRLFDSFKDEKGGALFIISLAERKFLFVNSVIKSLIGWSPEKFIKEFPQLITRGLPDWENALAKIKTTKECSLKVSILNRASEQKQFECYMGRISRGPFANHAVGLFRLKN